MKKKFFLKKPNLDKEISIPLLAFTYFFAVTIYVFLISFYFWLWKTDKIDQK